MADGNVRRDILPGTRLCLEMGARLSMKAKACHVPLAGDLIGMDPDRYLIVAAPHAAPECVEQLLGGPVTVSCFSKDAALSFESTVLTMISEPARLLFLEYPHTLQLHDRRSQKRMSCSVPARMESKAAIRQGTVVNINKRGCRCIIEHAENAESYAGLHEAVALKLAVTNLDHEIALSGRVSNISQYGQSTTLGILFQEGSLDAQKMLSRYHLSTYDYQ